MARTKVVVDPITRIEGHLRIEVQAENGRIADAWASSTQFRGIEIIMQGRDPRDAWAFTQRICGVCTVVHAVASCRAVEDALGIRVPPNANTIRNLVHGMQTVQDHVIHFYHLHALDWVDVVSALSADPAETSQIARSLSPWPNNSASWFGEVQERDGTRRRLDRRFGIVPRCRQQHRVRRLGGSGTDQPRPAGPGRGRPPRPPSSSVITRFDSSAAGGILVPPAAFLFARGNSARKPSPPC